MWSNAGFCAGEENGCVTGSVADGYIVVWSSAVFCVGEGNGCVASAVADRYIAVWSGAVWSGELGTLKQRDLCVGLMDPLSQINPVLFYFIYGFDGPINTNKSSVFI